MKRQALAAVTALVPVFLVGLITSCSTLSDSSVASLAEDAVVMIDNVEIDALVGSSGTPFLFETEILPAPAQLEALWSGLAASGYDFGPHGEIRILDPDQNTWKRFSSSREVQVWFERHAPENAALAVWPTQDGSIVLIIDRDRRSAAPYYGLKVEQES